MPGHAPRMLARAGSTYDLRFHRTACAAPHWGAWHGSEFRLQYRPSPGVGPWVSFPISVRLIQAQGAGRWLSGARGALVTPGAACLPGWRSSRAEDPTALAGAYALSQGSDSMGIADELGRWAHEGDNRVVLFSKGMNARFHHGGGRLIFHRPHGNAPRQAKEHQFPTNSCFFSPLGRVGVIPPSGG